MKDTVKDRLTYLAEQFDVFDYDAIAGGFEEKFFEMEKLGYEIKPIFTKNKNLIAIFSVKKNEKGRDLKKVSIFKNVFFDIIEADPTENKI